MLRYCTPLILLGFIELTTCKVTTKQIINRTDTTTLAIELIEFIPSSVLTFIGDLNDTDRNAFLEFIKNLSRTTDVDKESLKVLKERSENTYQKVMGVHNYILTKIERLKAESKAFIDKVNNKCVALFTNKPQRAPKGTFMKLKLFLNETFKIYDELSGMAKNDLKAAFPEIVQLITNPRFRAYIKRVFDNNDVKRAFNRADRMVNSRQF